MSANDSADGLMTASGRLYVKLLLWACGGSTAMLASTQAMTWGLTTLRTWLLATVGAMFLSTTMMAQAPRDAAATVKLNAEIDKAVDTYRRAVLAGDARAIAATYADDAIELPPGQPAVRGRAAIEQRYRDLCSGMKVTAFTFSHIESTIGGSVAYDVGTYEQHLARSSGETIIDRGKYVVILKRSQGEWKALYAIYNSDTPVPSSSAAPHR